MFHGYRRPTVTGARRVCAAALALVMASLPAAAAELTIGGSGTGLGAIRTLARDFSRARGVPVRVLPSIGSGGAVKALLMGDIDLGLGSRRLRPDELGRGLQQTLYARTPLVFAVRQDLPVSGITREQVHGIYSGALREWTSGLPLRLVLRPRLDSDTLLLAANLPELEPVLRTAYSQPTVVAYTDQETATILEQVEGSVATSSLTLLLSEERDLKALSLDGVRPTPENLRTGRYPLAKPLYFFTSAEPSTLALEFVDYVRVTGSDYLRRTGHQVITDGSP